MTKDQPKFDRGDEDVKEALRLASEIIARAWEGCVSCRAELSNEELIERFAELDESLNLMRMLRGLNAADRQIADEKDIILIFKDGSPDIEELEVHSFPSTTQALRALFDFERANPSWDVVLVRGERPSDVREAFKNYFSDARDFINLIEEGCRRLAGNRIVVIDKSGDVK